MAHDRVAAEREFHDRQAAERRAQEEAGSLQFTDDDYLNHESWIRPAIGKFGNLRGKTVLDYGCGHGMAATLFARQGAIVTGFDLSPGYVAEATRRAEANHVSATFLTADAEELPFGNESFDAVWGCAILHHLDLVRAGQELWRVLKPGGIAVFCEPWGGNPLLELARKRLPYPGKERTIDEKPLLPRDVVTLRRFFPLLSCEGYQIFGMLRRVWKNPRLFSILEGLDACLLNGFPSSARWCRYAVLTLPKP